MRFKYLLLDWDGCVVDSLNLWRSTLKQRLADLGVKATDKDVVSKVMGVRNAAEAFGLEMTPDEFWDPARDVVMSHVREVHHFPGVEDTVKQLFEKDVHMGIVTSTARRIYKEALGNRTIAQYFNASVTGTDVEKLKPDAESLTKLILELGANNEETLIVGDSPHDVQAGKNAGIATCLFYPKENHLFYSFEDLLAEEPTYLIEDFTDLLDIVLNKE